MNCTKDYGGEKNANLGIFPLLCEKNELLFTVIAVITLN